DSMLTEKFIRAVGKAVGAELGTARSQPLVLASVAEYLPIFRKASPYPAIHDQVIPGSPEHSQPEDLRSAAWRLINDSELARESVERDRAMSLVHNGKGSLDPAEIAHAGQEGRIDTLYLPRTGSRRQSSDAYALANDAGLSAVRTSGSPRTVGDEDGPAEALATFRYRPLALDRPCACVHGRSCVHMHASRSSAQAARPPALRRRASAGRVRPRASAGRIRRRARDRSRR